MPVTYVALLRGINVGGKNKLPMKDLVEMFVQAGCENVRHFIQSGNVVFRCASKVAAGLPGLIAEKIEQRFGYRTPVLVRTTKQLMDVVANNPFSKDGVAEEGLHVMFLS